MIELLPFRKKLEFEVYKVLQLNARDENEQVQRLNFGPPFQIFELEK